MRTEWVERRGRGEDVGKVEERGREGERESRDMKQRESKKNKNGKKGFFNLKASLSTSVPNRWAFNKIKN